MPRAAKSKSVSSRLWSQSVTKNSNALDLAHDAKTELRRLYGR